MSSCARHTACVQKAMDHAEVVCLRAGGRLTKTRRQVLELVWQSHKPRKAYDVLRDLAANDPSAKPPTVYRALDFLQDMGLVHKVETLDAYLGCTGGHAHQYMICRKCGAVDDIHDEVLARSVATRAQEKKFTVEKTSIEIQGICERCTS